MEGSSQYYNCSQQKRVKSSHLVTVAQASGLFFGLFFSPLLSSFGFVIDFKKYRYSLGKETILRSFCLFYFPYTLL